MVFCPRILLIGYGRREGMIDKEEEITTQLEDIVSRYARSTISGIATEANLETHRSLGRLEANVSHLEESNKRIENQINDHGSKLDSLEKILGRISRRQIYIGLAVTITVGVFLTLSEHWPVVRGVGDLLFDQPHPTPPVD